MEILRRNSDQDFIKECDEKEISENCNIKKYLSNIITREGYIKYKIYKRLINTGGANYMGMLRQIDVVGETAEGTKETSLFFKLKLPSYAQDLLADPGFIFSKEAYVYNKLSKIFNHLQEEACVPAHDRYNMAKNYDESDDDAIILENLSKKGYKLLNRLEVMPLTFMELSIIQLARFHGLSFVLNKKMPNYLKEKTELFKFPMSYNEEWHAYVKNICGQEINYLDSYFQTKINNVIPKIIEKFPKYVCGELASVKCLCHGDYRPSNILAKEEKGEVKDIIPVDYQTVFYGSPVIDFMYFINSSTDRQGRKNHLEHLKNLYYESLRKFLNYFHIEADSVYSRKQFEQDLMDYFDYGLFSAIIFFPFFFVEDDAPDLAKDSILELHMKLGQTFKERIEGVLQDNIDAGWL